jgi:RecG-like helicase
MNNLKCTVVLVMTVRGKSDLKVLLPFKTLFSWPHLQHGRLRNIASHVAADVAEKARVYVYCRLVQTSETLQPMSSCTLTEL